MHRSLLALTLGAALIAGPGCTPSRRSSMSTAHQLPILDTTMAYLDVGAGRPIVFLHGNPTSSYVWRDVLAALAGGARCLAPDLVGMGASGKPASAYRYADHARYLDAWFAQLDLRDVVVVGYDWGGVLAVDWAARHPDRVRAVVVFETFLRPMTWADWPPRGAELFRAYRTPGIGEAMVLERGEFLSNSLDHGVRRGLSDAERARYAAPYPDPASRRPLLQWPREIPIDGEPADVVAVIEANARWLATTATPRLLITVDGGSLSPPTLAPWAAAAFPGLAIRQVGPAGHHAPEDVPAELAATIDAWLAEAAR